MVKIEKVDWFLIIGLAAVLILSIILLVFDLMGINIGHLFSLAFWGTLIQATTPLGMALLIVFIVCVIGNLLPLPTPYSFILIPVAAAFVPFWWLTALVAAAGCVVGEIVGYLVGRGSREALRTKNIEKIEDIKLLAEKRPYLMMFLLYIFGATPLNDDMVTIPLGLAGFSMSKTVISMFLGKLTLMALMACLGAVGVFFPWELIPVIGPILEALFGGGSTEPGPFAWVEMSLIFAITIVIVWAMFKIDYKRFLKEKYGIEEMEE
ncbi:MAG: VTT domain-containing protein [Candidatus Helarchaeota archaeon]